MMYKSYISIIYVGSHCFAKGSMWMNTSSQKSISNDVAGGMKGAYHDGLCSFNKLIQPMAKL